MISIAGYCDEKVPNAVHVEDWTAAIQVTEILKDGHGPQHCDYLLSVYPEDNMPNFSVVTSTVCNYAAKSITMIATVNATSVLNVISFDSTQLYNITLEGMFVAIGNSQCI